MPEASDVDRLLAERYRTETFRCPLRTLSSVIDEHGLERIDLLKIDVEKSEAQVLRGIRPEHWDRIRQLVVEVHTRELLQEVTALLEQRALAFTVHEAIHIPPADGRAGVYLYLVYAFHPAQRRPAQEASGAGPELALDGLKQRLRATLPPPMIPGELHVVRSIPRTPNGKVDRRALPRRWPPGSERRRGRSGCGCSPGGTSSRSRSPACSPPPPARTWPASSPPARTGPPGHRVGAADAGRSAAGPSARRPR